MIRSERKAWQLVAEKVDQLPESSVGYLCHMVDDLAGGWGNLPQIAPKTVTKMKTRLADALGLQDAYALGNTTAYSDDDYTTDEHITEDRHARVTAALLFAEIAATEAFTN